jgi:Protein of unknown function (DUF3604)
MFTYRSRTGDKMIKRLLQLLGIIVLLLIFHVGSVYFNLFGQHQNAGQVTQASLPTEVIKQKAQNLKQANSPKQILFGDMHVHTTFSKDAFIMSLPILGGGGAHPPADACDFARYCAGLDFWGISDHAEGLTAAHWQETIDSIQQCNAVANDPDNPDMVAFLGWEWSQAGATADNHYGHKNVFFKGLKRHEIPARPIGSGGQGLPAQMVTGVNSVLSLVDFSNRQYYYDHQQFLEEYSATAPCPEGVPSPQLPSNCEEIAITPEMLNRKLDEWGFDSLLIPHGNAWGITAPMGADFATQLNRRDHDPKRQSLIEVFSGHGSSEHYRSWREVAYNDDGSISCPNAAANYLPGCKRAGEIIYQRCKNAKMSEQECRQRQQEAEQNYIDAGLLKGFLTVPGASINDWATADQCEDCFLPAYNYIPRSSVQYALALSRFDGESSDKQNKPLRFRFGMIGSSDNHAAKSGAGYKEFDRELMSESRTPKTHLLDSLLIPDRGESALKSVTADQLPSGLAMDRERYASFTLTGGLIAVHSQSRRREDLWSSMKQREVYATSGPQILLWFDLIKTKPNSESLPMGSELTMIDVPTFRVRAAGSFKQKPGCPEFVTQSLGGERMQSLCQGECFNPGNERYQISRIEVVRIRPQSYADEPVDPLIEDPWRTFECAPSNEGCEIVFEDEHFAQDQRDSVYYVRALQEPTDMINGQPFECLKQSTEGQCLEYRHCNVNNPGDNCIGSNQERAWSSPIFVDYGQ